MILSGFACPVCGGEVLDSIDHCFACKTPYTDTLAMAAQAHHQAKLGMVTNDFGRLVSNQQVFERVGDLAATSESIAATLHAGGTFTQKSISAIFRDRD